jgi:Kef-type K+ transport system membrane component KefB
MQFRLTSCWLLLLIPFSVIANPTQHGAATSLTMPLGLMLGGAAVSWSLSKLRLPSVIGELSLGMLLGVLAHFQIGNWAQYVANPTLAFLAELGSIFLLFEIGLESDLQALQKIGRIGCLSAVIGVVVPFILGATLLPYWLFEHYDLKLGLFLGATLAATSTGIAARVFKDLNITLNPACQIVLTASIIDDILGLIILTSVSALAVQGTISGLAIGQILLQVSLFFVISFGLSKLLPQLIKRLLTISNDEAMVMAILVSACLLWAGVAQAIGLATIIGAFIAGLLLEAKSFHLSQMPSWYHTLSRLLKNSAEVSAAPIRTQVLAPYAHTRLIQLIRPLNLFLVPIFFVYAGMQVDIVAAWSWQTLAGGLLIAVVAIVGKLSCALVIPRSLNRWLVGFGMVPRGEVGLIFALAGRELHIFNQQVFTMVLIMVVITSVITPLALEFVHKRFNREIHEAKIY